MLVKLEQFTGRQPRLDPHLLPETAAVVAQNCKIVGGSLRPWKNPLAVATPTKAGTKQSIFLYDSDYWLSWTQDVDVVKSPLGNDSYKRLYWTGEGSPKMATHDMIVGGGTDYPNASLDLGIPAPINAPTVSLGPDWTENTLASSGAWSVCFGNSKFVAVKSGGTEAATSSDGVTWTPRTLPTTANWNAVTYGNSIFVALGYGGTIAASSPDGITWTQRVLPVSIAWSSVIFGDTVFLATALASNKAATSPDGITWTEHDFPTGFYAGALCYGNGQFVVGPNGTDQAMLSPDGETWTATSLPNIVSTTVAGFGNGTYLLMADNRDMALTSRDGTVWTVQTMPAVYFWGGVAFGAGTFTVLAYNASEAFTSVDLGVTWASRGMISSKDWQSIAFGNSLFVAVTKTSDEVELLSNIDQTTQETRSYVYRYLSAVGGPGAPSPASTPVGVWPGQVVNLSAIDGVPTGNYDIASVQIYRTNTGSSTTAYQYVDVIAVGTTTYADSKTTATLGEVLDSLLWDLPPSDLSGLIALPQGSLCGFSGDELCFSVPYKPHAWPVSQRYPLTDPIVGIQSYGMNVLATTKATPYLVTIGDDLTALLPQRAETGYACVSKRGVVDMAGTIAYPEPMGLVTVGVNGIQLISAQLFDKDSWQSLNPSTITAFYYGGLYIAFTDIGAFVFNLGSFGYNQLGNMTSVGQDFSDLTDITATAGYHDPATGNLYLAIGSDIVKWDGDSSFMTYVWQSKPHIAPKPVNLSCAKVYADSYPVTFKLYADGVLKSTSTVANNEPFRLLGGYRAKEHSVGIEGTENVYRVYAAESMTELRTV